MWRVITGKVCPALRSDNEKCDWPACDCDNAATNSVIASLERNRIKPIRPILDEILRELEWMAEQYDDNENAYTLSARLYDVSCTARKLLARARGE